MSYETHVRDELLMQVTDIIPTKMSEAVLFIVLIQRRSHGTFGARYRDAI